MRILIDSLIFEVVSMNDSSNNKNLSNESQPLVSSSQVIGKLIT